MAAQKRKRASLADTDAENKATQHDHPNQPGPSTAAPAAAAAEITATPSSSKQPPSSIASRAPFFTGAAIHKALDTSSADSLRQALHQLRVQTSLTFAERENPTSIPPADPRIKVVQEYCQLCHDAATSAGPEAAAASVFAAWDLAEKQSLGPLLPLPIFVLAHILPLLSAHFPTQALGESIVNRLLSPAEPWFDLLQSYVSNSTTPAAGTSGNGKGRDQSHLNSDVAVLASLLLLREMASFGRGRFASRVFARFNWALKSLPKLLNRRRRRHAPSPKDAADGKDKGKARVRQAELEHGVTSLERPDIRTLYVLFLLSFLSQTYSSSLKVQLLDLGRDHLPQMLKGLIYDPPDVVHRILVTLHEELVCDNKVPRARKAGFLNEWACACIVKLYAREDDRTMIDEDGTTVQGSSVAELAHHFLLSISTHAGFGICYPDRGWYPRLSSASTSTAGFRGTEGEDADDGQLGPAGDEAEDEDEAGGLARIVGGSRSRKALTRNIYNKALAGVLPRLSVTEDLLQQELALGILRACPELVGPYLETSCGGLTLEPRTSSRWLCNAAYLGRVMSLELPSFRNARLQRAADGPSANRSQTGTAGFLSAYASQPPPLATIMSNVLPSPLSRQLFTRGLHSSDRLVRHTTASILCRCLERLARFRHACEEAAQELDESDRGPWRTRARVVEIEARKRLPEISIAIQMMQSLTGSASAASAASVSNGGGAPAVDGAAQSPSSNVLLIEVSLRLLWLYHLAVPSSALDSRFDVGKLLTNSFMAPLRRATLDEDGEPEKLNLQALCQVHALRIVSLSTETSFDWSARATAAANAPLSAKNAPGRSYLGLLLSIYVTTPLEQVRESCEELFERLVAPSNLFEHDPRELDAWLESLPATDANTAVVAASAAEDDGTEGSAAAMAGESDSATGPVAALSEEQAYVLGFFDECAQRCMKTPYRYIEAARRFLRESHVGQNGIDGDGGDDDQLVASPLLLTMFEQFTIRVRKALFEGEATVHALLAFFNRLMPLLAASGRAVVALDRMTRQIAEAVEDSEAYSAASTKYLCKTMIASVEALRIAPVPSLATANGNAMDEDGAEAGMPFTAPAFPADLRNQLRAAARPLSSTQVAFLAGCLWTLHRHGHSGAYQLLHELHPVEENVNAALHSMLKTYRLGQVPLHHLPAGQDLQAEDEIDVFANVDEMDAEQLRAWTTPVQAKLAAALAIERLSASAVLPAAERQLKQTASILRSVIAAGELNAVELETLVFAKPSLLACLSQGGAQASHLLFELSGIVAEVLRPADPMHRKLVAPILGSLRASVDAGDAEGEAGQQRRLESLLKLAPFTQDETFGQLTASLLTSLEAALPRQSGGDEASVVLVLELLNVSLGLDTSDVSKQHLASKSDVLSGLVSRLHAVEHSAGPVLNLLYEALSISPEGQAALEADDIEKLFNLDAGSGVDSLLFKAAATSSIQGETIASLLARSILADDDSVAKARMQRLTFTIRRSLRQLLEGGVGEEHWSEGVLSRLGKLLCDAMADVRPNASAKKQKGMSTASSAVELQLCACLDMLLLAVSRLERKTAVETVSEAILQLVSTAEPRQVFTTASLALTASILAHASVGRLATAQGKGFAIVQAMLDKGLLFLVRRFAEDDNDGADLVDRIEFFIPLVSDVSARDVGTVSVKAHLADPVIEASFRNRMLSSAPIRLVLALCRSASGFKVAQLSRYLSTITSHADFNAIATGTATLLPALPPSEDEDGGASAATALADLDSDEAEAQQAEEQHQHRQTVLQVIHAIVSRHATDLSAVPIMTKLLSVYGGSLSRADRCLLDLFRSFEEDCGMSFLSLARHWASPSAGATADALSSQGRLVDALLSLDPTMVFATCTEYPRAIPLRRSPLSGYRTDAAQSAVATEGHSDPATRYDPVLVFALLAGTLAETKVSGFEWLQILRTNVLGVIVCGLSSRCADMRKGCLELLGKCYSSVAEAGFAQRDYVLLALDLLRGCIPKDAYDDSQRGWETPPSLPLTTSLFIAHTLRSIGQPWQFTFPLFQKFLLQRPTLDATDVPLLYNMLYSSTDTHRQERIWMLRFLRDVARAGGKAEWKVWRRRHVWELLTSLYDSVAAGGLAAVAATGKPASAPHGSSNGDDARIITALIEDTATWLLRIPAVATELVVRRGALAWLADKVKRAASRPQSPATATATIGEGETPQRTRDEELHVWLGMLRQLLDHADIQRWHRASSGTWSDTLAATVDVALAALVPTDDEDSAAQAARRTADDVLARLHKAEAEVDATLAAPSSLPPPPIAA